MNNNLPPIIDASKPGVSPIEARLLSAFRSKDWVSCLGIIHGAMKREQKKCIVTLRAYLEKKTNVKSRK
jgi:hypothetical protein